MTFGSCLGSLGDMMHICGGLEGRFRFGASPLAYFEGSKTPGVLKTKQQNEQTGETDDFGMTLGSLWG